MKRARKIRLALIAVLIVGALIAAETLIESISEEETVRIVERQLSEATGLDIDLGSDFHLELIPVVRFEAHAVRASEPGRPFPPVLKVETLHLELDPWQLLFGVIEIEELHLHDSELALEAHADGRADDRRGASSVPVDDSGTSETDVEFRLRRLQIEEFRIAYYGASKVPVRVIDVAEGTLEAKQFDEPLRVELGGAFEGDPFSVEGTVGPLKDFVNPREPYPVSLRGKLREMTIEAEGTLAKPAKLSGVAVRVRLDSSDLTFLRAFVANSLPAIDRIRLDAKLSDEDGSLGIDGKFTLAAQSGQISGEISGKLGDLTQADDIDARISLRARDLAQLGREWMPALSLPEVGPVDVSASIRGSARALRAEDLSVKVGNRDAAWLEAGGSVADLDQFTGVQLAAEFGGADLRYANPFLGRQLPDAGPVRGSATLSDRDGSLGIEQMRIAGESKGRLKFDISGRIDQMRSWDDIDVDAEIEAKSLALVGELLGIDLPPIGPVAFSGRLSGSDEKIVSQGRTRLDQTVFVGDWSGSFAGSSRPSITARLDSDRVRLEDLGIAPRADGEDAEADRERPASWWSSLDPWPFEWLERADVDLELDAARVSGRAGFELGDVRVSGRLEGGRLEIPEFTVGYEAGTIRLRAVVDASGSPAQLSLKASVNDVDLTPLLAQVRQTVEEAGVLDASIDLESRGNQALEIRSNLAGTARFVARDGTLATRYSRDFVKNFATLAVPSVITGTKPRFGCIVADFEIDHGLATARELRLDSPAVSVIGSGTVDVGADKFDISLLPRVHKPGLVTLAAAVRVSGPLSDPVFTPQYASMPMQAVRGLLSNVLAPGSALIKPFRKSKAELPCDDLQPVPSPGDP